MCCKREKRIGGGGTKSTEGCHQHHQLGRFVFGAISPPIHRYKSDPQPREQEKKHTELSAVCRRWRERDRAEGSNRLPSTRRDERFTAAPDSLFKYHQIGAFEHNDGTDNVGHSVRWERSTGITP